MIGVDLRALVDAAQSELLQSSSVTHTDDVIEWIGARGVELGDEERQSIIGLLKSHPNLVPASIPTGMWNRDRNLGLPKRRPIGRR